MKIEYFIHKFSHLFFINSASGYAQFSYTIMKIPKYGRLFTFQYNWISVFIFSNAAPFQPE